MNSVLIDQAIAQAPAGQQNVLKKLLGTHGVRLFAAIIAHDPAIALAYLMARTETEQAAVLADAIRTAHRPGNPLHYLL